MVIKPVQTAAEIEEVRCLFREYAGLLKVDLCFQGFEAEVASLPGKYNPPNGSLLLALEDKNAAGCVALRQIAPGLCEMKRLFVRPQFQGRGYGKALAQRIIEVGVELGYATMRLDTLAQLKAAMNLYAALGFRQTNPYYTNPLPGVVYWELDLRNWKS